MAQRPVTTNPNQQRTRELVDPQEEEEETDGRRPLLDDSTKQVYGPKTSLYFSKKTSRETT
ncbi:hypothetical protein V8V91_24940 [Algoriphagus halophilus]|uniref:hypothetical protein n=1 Tax=Algoriphagus halophilus TaxID=226505 RepID=UPI00358F1E32